MGSAKRASVADRRRRARAHPSRSGVRRSPASVGSSTSGWWPASATRKPAAGQRAPASAGNRRSPGLTGGATYGESPGCSVPRGPVLLAQLGEQRVEGVGVPLAGVLRDDVALRVDQHQRRPGAGGVGLPGHQLGVVEDGVVRPRSARRRRPARRGRPRATNFGECTPTTTSSSAYFSSSGRSSSRTCRQLTQQKAQKSSSRKRPRKSASAVRRAAGVQPAAAAQLGGADAGSVGHVHIVASEWSWAGTRSPRDGSRPGRWTA